MKKLLLGSVILAASLMSVHAAPYKLDVANSAVKFNVSHLKLTSVDGDFKEFSGVIDYADGKLNVLEGSVAIKSINTSNQKRDNHLNAPDMFDSAKYPHLNFKMTKFEGNKIHGDLTIKTITKPVVLDAKVVANGKELTIDATTMINRNEFGIGWESVFQDNAVGEDVKIMLNLKAHQQ